MISAAADNTEVTVIGLGPMGQAMALALIRAGHSVTVWNRTPSRASGLVNAGAFFAPTPADALRASPITILSLTDYQAMHQILDGATDALAGATLVNLSSDTPATTREAASWATRHGAQFLAGGVMVPAPMVGTEAASCITAAPQTRSVRTRERLAGWASRGMSARIRVSRSCGIRVSSRSS